MPPAPFGALYAGRQRSVRFRAHLPVTGKQQCKEMATRMTANGTWIAIGFLGQLFFTSRFLVQWIVSERRRESVIPVAFWWLSLLGGITLFCYALWRRDPVFILGQATGLLVYARNLMLLGKARHEAAA